MAVGRPSASSVRLAVVIGAVVAVAVALLIVMVTGRQADSGVAEIGANGGTARSANGDVVVRFGKGEADPETRVAVRSDRSGPPPPPMVEPLTRPFEIEAESGAIRRGTVTVRLDGLRRPKDAEGVVMVIDDGRGGWRALDTAVDVGKGTATARWPHFSRGFVGRLTAPFNVAAAAGANAVNWSWDKMADSAEAVREFAADAKDAAIDGAVAITGGTTDSVKCSPASQEWTFRGTNAQGGHQNFAPLTGCAEPSEGRPPRWRVKVGDRYPYPFLLSMPAGVVGPGFLQSAASGDLVDALISVAWGMNDRVVVPGGGETVVELGPTDRMYLELSGFVDPSTLAVKALAVAALIASRGASAEVRAALRAEVKALEAAFIADRKAGRTDRTLAEFIKETDWNSDLARRQRAASGAQAAAGVATAFAVIDHLNCLVALGGDVSRAEDVRAAVRTVASEMIDRCWPSFADAIVRVATDETLAQLDPHRKQAEQKRLIEGLLEQAQDIPRLAAAAHASVVFSHSGGHFNYLTATLQIDRVDRFQGVDWSRHVPDCPIAGEQFGPGLRGKSTTLITRPPLRRDVNGDAEPDILVTATCQSPTSSQPETVSVFDGASPPDAPTRLGLLLEHDDDIPRAVDVSVGGDRAVVLRAAGMSKEAANCCPDIVVTYRYRLDGDRFVREDRSVERCADVWRLCR